jgi:multicomponent Na+:H+ antiporter subunit D
MAAPLTVLLRRRDLAFGVALLASWTALLIAVLLWLQVEAGGTLSYAIGNWPPPWGIEYRVDRLNAFVLVLVAGLAAVVLPYSRASIETEVPAEQHYLFYTMFVLCLTGLLGMAITGDAFNIFVFLEISSLSTYVLVALGSDRRALLASYQYLVMGTIGATFIVVGIGLLYLVTGTLNLVDMGRRLALVDNPRPVLAALAFLTVGLSLKLALFPLHQWLPNAYSYAPTSVAAFLAGTATKVAVYVMIRFYFSVFSEAQAFAILPTEQMLLILGLAGAFAASTIAVFQTDLKRLFAYSSVAQIGYIILGISFHSVNGLTASIVHLAMHGMAKAAVFMLLGGVVLVMGGTTLARVQGLGYRMPFTSLGIVICGLSLVGVPGTGGFISKWHLILAALERGQWWLAFLIVASSLIAAAYVWRFIEAAYFREPRSDIAQASVPWSMALPALLLVVASVVTGLYSSAVLASAHAAAVMLLGPR